MFLFQPYGAEAFLLSAFILIENYDRRPCLASTVSRRRKLHLNYESILPVGVYHRHRDLFDIAAIAPPRFRR
jgi:hypothetical protein